ncbi:hypothetical protein Csa_016605 [Cucumis sativus]|uniref:Uncharacterized protein n=1 Tax=Cucumis sativus TaxID=3659 RepID=A0A0A0KC93_CUCSA|nr:hypothetical protein Csa_016605 [Cucumis sativus]
MGSFNLEHQTLAASPSQRRWKPTGTLATVFNSRQYLRRVCGRSIYSCLSDHPLVHPNRRLGSPFVVVFGDIVRWLCSRLKSVRGCSAGLWQRSVFCEGMEMKMGREWRE